MARAILAAVVAFFLAAVLLASASASATAAVPSDIPAVFAFGDSTLDPGNNNGLATLVRADHAPYGCGFPGGTATGRFSDGKLITDYIVESLGIKDLLPAYRASGLTVAEASTGVSFASGGSGIDDLTAQTAMVFTFGSQISDFRDLLGKIGMPRAAEIAGRSLYVVSAGTNDVAMNYFILPVRADSFPTIDQYSDYLIGRLQGYLQVRTLSFAHAQVAVYLFALITNNACRACTIWEPGTSWCPACRRWGACR
jgi:phospholipase/lecithinase/hemolysin